MSANYYRARHSRAPAHAKPRNAVAVRTATAFGLFLVIVTLGFAGYVSGSAVTARVSTGPVAAVTAPSQSPGHVEAGAPSADSHGQVAPHAAPISPVVAHALHVWHVLHMKHLAHLNWVKSHGTDVLRQ